MAFVLTPRFAPAYQAPQYNPFGCAPLSQPICGGYRVSRPQPRRPQYSPFALFSQVDELLSEIDREVQRQAQREAHLEAQREAHRQRQLQRKRALRAKFDVSQNEQGWQIDGDFQGFTQDNISIEVTNGNTLKIAGNTHWQSEMAQPEVEQPQIEAAPAIEQPTVAAHDEPEIETTTTGAATPDNDTSSHKSYQPTVEDDFEDLAAEASALFSSSPATATPTDPKDPKGKGRAVEEPATTETAVVPQPQPEVSAQQPQQERVHGSFERTFTFPERIDTSNVSASFKDGVLRITVPRAQVPQIRRIAIL
jgi:HSP20 family molecular chaperone IbpA